MSKWTIAEARRRFARLLGDVAREPQAIYRRSKRIAGIVDADELEAFEAWRDRERRRSLADEFRDLGLVREDDGPVFEAPARKNRRSSFDRSR
jgi:prevent-host-death family protein